MLVNLLTIFGMGLVAASLSQIGQGHSNASRKGVHGIQKHIRLLSGFNFTEWNFTHTTPKGESDLTTHIPQKLESNSSQIEKLGPDSTTGVPQKMIKKRDVWVPFEPAKDMDDISMVGGPSDYLNEDRKHFMKQYIMSLTVAEARAKREVEKREEETRKKRRAEEKAKKEGMKKEEDGAK